MDARERSVYLKLSRFSFLHDQLRRGQAGSSAELGGAFQDLWEIVGGPGQRGLGVEALRLARHALSQLGWRVIGAVGESLHSGEWIHSARPGTPPREPRGHVLRPCLIPSEGRAIAGRRGFPLTDLQELGFIASRNRERACSPVLLERFLRFWRTDGCVGPSEKQAIELMERNGYRVITKPWLGHWIWESEGDHRERVRLPCVIEQRSGIVAQEGERGYPERALHRLHRMLLRGANATDEQEQELGACIPWPSLRAEGDYERAKQLLDEHRWTVIDGLEQSVVVGLWSPSEAMAEGLLPDQTLRPYVRSPRGHRFPGTRGSELTPTQRMRAALLDASRSDLEVQAEVVRSWPQLSDADASEIVQIFRRHEWTVIADRDASLCSGAWERSGDWECSGDLGAQPSSLAADGTQGRWVERPYLRSPSGRAFSGLRGFRMTPLDRLRVTSEKELLRTDSAAPGEEFRAALQECWLAGAHEQVISLLSRGWHVIHTLESSIRQGRWLPPRSTAAAEEGGEPGGTVYLPSVIHRRAPGRFVPGIRGAPLTAFQRFEAERFRFERSEAGIDESSLLSTFASVWRSGGGDAGREIASAAAHMERLGWRVIGDETASLRLDHRFDRGTEPRTRAQADRSQVSLPCVFPVPGAGRTSERQGSRGFSLSPLHRLHRALGRGDTQEVGDCFLRLWEVAAVDHPDPRRGAAVATAVHWLVDLHGWTIVADKEDARRRGLWEPNVDQIQPSDRQVAVRPFLRSPPPASRTWMGVRGFPIIPETQLREALSRADERQALAVFHRAFKSATQHGLPTTPAAPEVEQSAEIERLADMLKDAGWRVVVRSETSRTEGDWEPDGSHGDGPATSTWVEHPYLRSPRGHGSRGRRGFALHPLDEVLYLLARGYGRQDWRRLAAAVERLSLIQPTPENRERVIAALEPHGWRAIRFWRDSITQGEGRPAVARRGRPCEDPQQVFWPSFVHTRHSGRFIAGLLGRELTCLERLQRTLARGEGDRLIAKAFRHAWSDGGHRERAEASALMRAAGWSVLDRHAESERRQPGAWEAGADRGPADLVSGLVESPFFRSPSGREFQGRRGFSPPLFTWTARLRKRLMKVGRTLRPLAGQLADRYASRLSASSTPEGSDLLRFLEEARRREAGCQVATLLFHPDDAPLIWRVDSEDPAALSSLGEAFAEAFVELGLLVRAPFPRVTRRSVVFRPELATDDSMLVCAEGRVSQLAELCSVLEDICVVLASDRAPGSDDDCVQMSERLVRLSTWCADERLLHLGTGKQNIIYCATVALDAWHRCAPERRRARRDELLIALCDASNMREALSSSVGGDELTADTVYHPREESQWGVRSAARSWLPVVIGRRHDMVGMVRFVRSDPHPAQLLLRTAAHDVRGAFGDLLRERCDELSQAGRGLDRVKAIIHFCHELCENHADDLQRLGLSALPAQVMTKTVEGDTPDAQLHEDHPRELIRQIKTPTDLDDYELFVPGVSGLPGCPPEQPVRYRFVQPAWSAAQRALRAARVKLAGSIGLNEEIRASFARALDVMAWERGHARGDYRESAERTHELLVETLALVRTEGLAGQVDWFEALFRELSIPGYRFQLEILAHAPGLESVEFGWSPPAPRLIKARRQLAGEVILQPGLIRMMEGAPPVSVRTQSYLKPLGDFERLYDTLQRVLLDVETTASALLEGAAPREHVALHALLRVARSQLQRLLSGRGDAYLFGNRRELTPDDETVRRLWSPIDQLLLEGRRVLENKRFLNVFDRIADRIERADIPLFIDESAREAPFWFGWGDVTPVGQRRPLSVAHMLRDEERITDAAFCGVWSFGSRHERERLLQHCGRVRTSLRRFRRKRTKEPLSLSLSRRPTWDQPERALAGLEELLGGRCTSMTPRWVDSFFRTIGQMQTPYERRMEFGNNQWDSWEAFGRLLVELIDHLSRCPMDAQTTLLLETGLSRRLCDGEIIMLKREPDAS